MHTFNDEQYLTRMEHRILCFISDFTKTYRYSPTLAEIAEGCYTSKTYAHTVVKKLKEKGYVDYREKKIRTIVVKEQ